MMEEVNIFWFRRDLRLYDNSGLSAATHSKIKVIPVFIFDTSKVGRIIFNGVPRATAHKYFFHI